MSAGYYFLASTGYLLVRRGGSIVLCGGI